MFGDIGKMMKMVGELKTKIPEMQAKLAASEYQAQAGDGAVIATVSGKLKLVGLEINPNLFANDEVDAADLAQLLGSWGPCVDCPADLNNDGIVNAADLAQLLGNWGPCEEQCRVKNS